MLRLWYIDQNSELKSETHENMETLKKAAFVLYRDFGIQDFEVEVEG